ncbi:lipoate--protein ligase family protein [Dendrosporobacter sp. 1207_IL3150]|uniref:lipoate--protein ligase family protein n=1 Tax=Dendrosporobacter sp. 1207_IL3150 TaxID=3084054 RepID=UPI002FD926D9
MLKWRFIDSGFANAAVNMAVDEAILTACSDKLVPSTFRLYGWKPAAVSLGYFQKATEEIDIVECQRLGIDIVRRLTGGRAVLHETELTYSIIVNEDEPEVPSSILASYRYFCNGLLCGLQRLGIKAQMNMPKGAYGNRHKSASAACFDSPSQYEVTYENRKLVGSAQVRKNGVILQHGSILLKFSPELVGSVFLYSSPEMRVRTIKLLEQRAVSIEQILGRNIPWEELCAEIRDGFSQAMGIGLFEDDLTKNELQISTELANKKYSKDSWNFK